MPTQAPRPTAADESGVAAAAGVLRAGGLVAFPTETVYGLGADARNPTAVDRIFQVKGRPRGHPLIVHIADASQVDDWALDAPEGARSLAESIWPGPLTLLLRRRPDVDEAVVGGRSTVGLRVPSHPVALALLREFGGGVAAPSANKFGRVSPTSALHVAEDLGSGVDLVLDGGACEVGVESTIVDLSGDRPEVLRLGGVPVDAIAGVLGEPVTVWDGVREVAAPGTLGSHYSPSARVVLADDALEASELAVAESAAGGRVGVLAPDLLDLPPVVLQLEPGGPPAEYARVLYSRLRQADALGLTVLVVLPPSGSGIGAAVVDRLERAAHED